MKPALPSDLTRDSINRLKTIHGQVGGLIQLLEAGAFPEKILNQFKAVDKGLQKAYYLLLDEVYRKALAVKIAEVIAACPGNCGHEGHIEVIRKQFPELKMDELARRFAEIEELKNQIEGSNSSLG